MNRGIVLDILVLTEDTSSDAHATVWALLKKALSLVEPCDTSRIHPEPQGPHARTRAFRASLWKSTKDRRALVDLRQEVAEWLVLPGPPATAVVFHFDGDAPWSGREGAENPKKFETQVRAPVREILTELLGAERAGEAAERLRTFVPFWSIEAWCYQNTAEAARICDENPKARPAASHVRAWVEDPASLDELVKPKEACALGSQHNRRLAEHAWPAERVYGLDRSFTAAVHEMAESVPLVAALRATRS